MQQSQHAPCIAIDNSFMIVTQHSAETSGRVRVKQAHVQVWMWGKVYWRSMVSFLLAMTSSREIANKEKWKRQSVCLSNQRISSGPHRSWNAEVPEQAPVFVHIKCWSSWPGGGSSVLCTPILRICRFWVKISPDHVWKRVSSQDFVGFWIDLVVEYPFRNPRWRCRGMKGQRTVDPCHCSFPHACSLRQTTWCY